MVWNKEFICDQLDSPIKDYTALVHFLTAQQQRIIVLDEYQNPQI